MLAKTVSALIIFQSIFSVFSDTILESCEKVDYSKYVYRTSTTLYDDVRGYDKIDHEGCEPHKIWAMFRHGIRNNYANSSNRARRYGAEFKPKILKMNKLGKGSLCPEDITAISSWHFDDLVTFEPHLLTQRGKNDMYKVGQRFASLFPEILNTTYNPQNIKMAYGKSQRTVATCRAFAKGLYENDSNFDELEAPFFSDVAELDCHMVKTSIYEQYYDRYPPAAKFYEDSGLYVRVAKSMAARTGLPVAEFTNEVIRTFYESCTYESAKNEKLSPWCRLFGLDDLRWMGYREEFIYYSFASYGSKYVNQLGCKQMKDLISTFDEAEFSIHQNHSFIAYFANDIFILELLTVLGCFKDLVPITNHYKYFNTEKKWDQSKLSPFGGNLIAVLYRCSYIADDYKLQFYLNENPIGCCMTNSTKACSWNQFRNRMADFVSDCKEFFCIDELKNKANALQQNVLLLLYSFVTISVCNRLSFPSFV